MSQLLVKNENNILSVSINRPDKHNAFNPEMIAELQKIFSGVEASVRAILLRGEGKSFCAGGDLEWMKSMAKYSFSENQTDAKQLFQMYETIKNCPVPVLGKVHGSVFGGGLGLTAVCDIVGAVDDAKFCFSEAKLGLVPAVISPFVLRRMNISEGREYMLTAKVFGVAEAKVSGLVNFFGSNHEVDAYLDGVLKEIKGCGPEAVRETKKLIGFVKTNPWDKVQEQCTKVIAERRASAEGQEGLAAFFEKRTPAWKQK